MVSKWNGGGSKSDAGLTLVRPCDVVADLGAQKRREGLYLPILISFHLLNGLLLIPFRDHCGE